ncbi:acyltransferase [soil metagenome]
MPIKQPINSLTGLRFVAAFMVVIVHFGDPKSPQLLHNIISHGFVAVSLFFILSGFILTYSYCDNDGSLNTGNWNFWVSRFARIYPVYLLGFLIYAPMAIHGIAAIDPHSPWASTGLFAAAALTLMQSWSKTSALVWNSPAWSLSAEAFFYLLFPFVAPLVLKLKLRGLVVAAIILWVASLGASIAHLEVADFDRNFWMFNPLMRLPEFLLGIVLGKCWKIRKPGSFEKYSAYISVASAFIIVAIFSINDKEGFFYNGTLAPLIMLLIFSLACNQGMLARILATRPMVLLGEASYSLYILHWPLWFAITDFLVNDLHRFQKGPSHFLACEAITIAASLLAFKFLEQPANRYLKNALRSWKNPQPISPSFL